MVIVPPPFPPPSPPPPHHHHHYDHYHNHHHDRPHHRQYLWGGVGPLGIRGDAVSAPGLELERGRQLDVALVPDRGNDDDGDDDGDDDDDHAFLRGVGSVALCGNQDRKRGWLSRWNAQEQPCLRSSGDVATINYHWGRSGKIHKSHQHLQHHGDLHQHQHYYHPTGESPKIGSGLATAPQGEVEIGSSWRPSCVLVHLGMWALSIRISSCGDGDDDSDVNGDGDGDGDGDGNGGLCNREVNRSGPLQGQSRQAQDRCCHFVEEVIKTWMCEFFHLNLKRSGS